jgi:hypothetical protein
MVRGHSLCSEDASGLGFGLGFVADCALGELAVQDRSTDIISNTAHRNSFLVAKRSLLINISLREHPAEVHC